jgi:L-lactate dehydrogenase complex protein LldE
VRVALFITCMGDTLFPRAGRATVTLLERLGHEVVFPEQQTCCGQMHLNSGYAADGRRLAARWGDVFRDEPVVVSPASSCVGHLRHLDPSLHGRLFELSELLVGKLGLEDVGAVFPHRVVYHPTCHSLRLTQIGDAPYRLLRAVKGLELLELPRADECCGFGGTFSVKNASTSVAMVDDKCAAVEATGAEVCTAADTSCLMQIGGRLARRGATVRTAHLAEILA